MKKLIIFICLISLSTTISSMNVTELNQLDSKYKKLYDEYRWIKTHYRTFIAGYRQQRKSAAQAENLYNQKLSEAKKKLEDYYKEAENNYRMIKTHRRKLINKYLNQGMTETEAENHYRKKLKKAEKIVEIIQNYKLPS